MQLLRELLGNRPFFSTLRRFLPACKAALEGLAAAIMIVLLVALFTGCSHIEPRVQMPDSTTAKPIIPVTNIINNGAIFQLQGAHRPLFEDQKPRYVGDILTVAIQEKTSASRSSKSSAGKTSEVKAAVPSVAIFPGKGLQGADLKASSGNTFEGKGETANDNAFSGTITVTVVSVLPNGNMMVAGEKQIGINHNTEVIRFTGIVSPVNVQAGNVVASSAIADARLEYRGKGYIDEAQRMGLLQRFFLSFLPF